MKLEIFIFVNLVSLFSSVHGNTRDVDGVCVALHCGLQSTACALDGDCSKVLSCMTGCFGQPDEAACQFICQWELGQSNEKYLKLLTCMGENGCLTMQPDGVCLSSASDTTTEITSLDQIQGDWWILKGQNCGQNELWNGGYDAYPCQLESYIQLPGTEDWVRNTTYCFGQDDTCSSATINIKPAATIESPGVVRTTYDNPLYMDMEERWFIVERIEEDWMFYVWCSENLAAADAGAVVLGRARSIEDMPKSVEDRMRELTAQLNLDYDSMCVNDNTNCAW